MRIKELKAGFFRVASKQSYRMGPMETGGDHYFGFLVQLVTESGVVGCGETFVTPGWFAPDTPYSMIGLVERQFGPALVGVDVLDLERIAVTMDRIWPLGNLFAKAAIDMAAHDAAARSIGRPVCDLMGGRMRTRFPVAAGIGHDTPEAMAASAKTFVERGFRTIKLKIGAVGDPDLDVIRVRMVREEVGPHVKLRVDGNGVFGVKEAIRLIRRLERYDLDHIEQPVPGWHVDGMAEIRTAIDAPLMADEAIHSINDAYRVVKAGAADVVKIKIAKSGGYRKSLQIAALCASAGIDVTIGQGIGASLQALAELHLACSQAAIVPAGEFIGPDKLETDIVSTPLQFDNGDAVLPESPGCGAELDLALLERATVKM